MPESYICSFVFFFSSRRRHTRLQGDWSSDVCSSDLEQVCYVGDDVIDLPVMRLCGLAIAVKNSRDEVLREAHYVTPHEGGRGAVRDEIGRASCRERV